jgi:hypothetical protein
MDSRPDFARRDPHQVAVARTAGSSRPAKLKARARLADHGPLAERPHSQASAVGWSRLDRRPWTSYATGRNRPRRAVHLQSFPFPQAHPWQQARRLCVCVQTGAEAQGNLKRRID